MNRTLLLLLAVLLLGGAAWYLASGQGDRLSVSEKSNERQFAYKDFDNIDRIFIADRLDHTVNLTRGGETGWLADGRPANDNVMDNLITTLRSMDIRSLPNSKAIPRMIKVLAAEGIRVQLYDKKDRKVRDFYIGGGTHDALGTFAIMDGSENPYVVHIPNFTGNIRARFNHWGDEWRDRVYFRVDPDKVETFSIEYPKLRDRSFVLEQDGEDFRISPFYETGQPVRPVARGIAERALAKFEKYYVNRYENKDTEAITEARELLPFAIIRIKQEDQDEQVMKVYPRYRDGSTEIDPKSGEQITRGGLEAYTAFINNDEDWVLLNVETTNPLFVGYEHFL